eukprot:g17425.t1
MGDAGEAGRDKSRFLHVDGKAATYFTACGSKSFGTILQEQEDAFATNKEDGTAAVGQVQGAAAPSPKRRNPKKIKVG